MQLCLQCKKPTKNPKFCNRSCSATYNNRKRAGVKCQNCKNPIDYNRKYCDNNCQNIYYRNLKIKALERGEYVGENLRFPTGGWAKNYLLERFDHKCQSCGVGEEWNGKPLTLEAEHIDGYANNNSIENLSLLCPNCHSQTSTYKNKNPVSTRTTRYQKNCS